MLGVLNPMVIVKWGLKFSQRLVKCFTKCVIIDVCRQTQLIEGPCNLHIAFYFSPFFMLRRMLTSVRLEVTIASHVLPLGLSFSIINYSLLKAFASD